MFSVELEKYEFSKHGKQTFKWVKDETLMRDFLIREKPNWESHVKYINKILKDTTQKFYAFTVNDKYAGNCGLKNIDLKRRMCELWLYIGFPCFKGKGIGSTVLNKLCEIAYKDLSMEIIYLHVGEFNNAAISLYQKHGFTVHPSPFNESQWDVFDCPILYMQKVRDSV